MSCKRSLFFQINLLHCFHSEGGGSMDFNYENEDKPYSSEEAYDDLEKIRERLHAAKRKINKDKLKKTEIDIEIKIDIPSE